ncbi:MAG: AEC family transporter [Lachnospiraceae bacterium]|nr:AEC family transporter [Lachnospiraceae bacterium]
MISLILIKKILSLFVILFVGIIMVKAKVVKPEESKTISTLMLFVITPCSILTSFEVDLSRDVVSSFLLAVASAIVIHFVLIICAIPMRKVLKMDPIEIVSVMYSNAGNLIIPLVTAIFGSEWVIYATAYMAVQLVFLWSHGKASVSGEKGIDLKKVLTNVNLISVFLGIIIFITGFRFPGPVDDAMVSMSAMIGPSAMLVTGMLIGSKNFKELLSHKRLPLVVFLRLIAVPVITLLIMYVSGAAHLVENGTTILLISLLATTTPSASTITQMAVVYDGDADYASAINVFSTLVCIITMPLVVTLYQSLIG